MVFLPEAKPTGLVETMSVRVFAIWCERRLELSWWNTRHHLWPGEITLTLKWPWPGNDLNLERTMTLKWPWPWTDHDLETTLTLKRPWPWNDHDLETTMTLKRPWPYQYLRAAGLGEHFPLVYLFMLCEGVPRRLPRPPHPQLAPVLLQPAHLLLLIQEGGIATFGFELSQWNNI